MSPVSSLCCWLFSFNQEKRECTQQKASGGFPCVKISPYPEMDTFPGERFFLCGQYLSLRGVMFVLFPPGSHCIFIHTFIMLQGFSPQARSSVPWPVVLPVLHLFRGKRSFIAAAPAIGSDGILDLHQDLLEGFLVCQSGPDPGIHYQHLQVDNYLQGHDKEFIL